MNNQLERSNSTIHPNPFSEKINLANLTGLEVYFLFNTLVQVIWKGKNIQSHDFASLTNEIYFLKVASNSGEQTIKMIKNQ